MKRKYSSLYRNKGKANTPRALIGKKLKLFNSLEGPNQSLTQKGLSGKLKLVCVMTKSGYQCSEKWSNNIHSLIANHQINPKWCIALFDRYSVPSQLKIYNQRLLRNTIPNLKQDGMGLFIFKNCKGSISLQESELEYCTRMIITSSEQHFVLDSHLQISIDEIEEFINSDLEYLIPYLKEHRVELQDVSTQITIIYGPHSDFMCEDDSSEEDSNIPGVLIAFMLEEKLGRPITSMKASPNKISQIDLDTGLISRAKLADEEASDADDESNPDDKLHPPRCLN